MNNQLTIFLWAGLISLCLLTASCQKNELTYQLADGQALNFSKLKGRVVLINYWATWCKPCRTEISELNTLHDKWKAKVVVLGVNYDGAQGDQLKIQIKDMGIKFPTLTTDPRKKFNVQASGVLPETLVIDSKGNLKTVLLGAQTIESLLGIINGIPTTN